MTIFHVLRHPLSEDMTQEEYLELPVSVRAQFKEYKNSEAWDRSVIEERIDYMKSLLLQYQSEDDDISST